MGIHDTIMRAAVADMTSIRQRGRAYGILHTIYGGAWFLGSAVMGYLYVYSAPAVVLFTIVLEGASIAVYFLWRKER